MTEQEAERILLIELEEWLEEDDVLGLYIFWWSLSETGLSDDAKERVCRKVYAELTRQHDLRLVWLPWPTDVSQARPVEPGTPLDFRLDPDEPSRAPLMSLIPASG